MTVASPSRAVAARPRWHAHSFNRPGYYRLALAAAPRLPRPLRAWLAARVARACAPRFPAERAAVRRNLTRVHPGKDPTWLDQAVERVFETFAVCFADFLSLNREREDRVWRHVAGVADQVPTREALASGRGCVSITAHLGNWDLAGRVLAALGRPVHVIMAPEVDPGVARALERRSEDLVRIVRLESPSAAVGLVSALRRGEVVAFQIDRALGGRGDCRVPFFGAAAAVPLGPFLLAATAGAPVVPAFCVLEGGGYRLHVEPAFSVRRGEEIDGLRRAVSVLERYVATYWEQWFNFFDVWDCG